jgi:hypothetical protein
MKKLLCIVLVFISSNGVTLKKLTSQQREVLVKFYEDSINKLTFDKKEIRGNGQFLSLQDIYTTNCIDHCLVAVEQRLDYFKKSKKKLTLLNLNSAERKGLGLN